MNYKKSAALFSLVAIPMAVTMIPNSEVFAEENKEKFSYYWDGNYYSSQASYVEYLINQINASHSSFQYNLQLAHNAYEALTAIEKAQVSNAWLLMNYLNTYTNNQTIVSNFTAKMAAISIRNSTFIRDVDAASRYYNALTSLEKAAIPTYLVTQLQNYKDRISEMKAVEERFAALNVLDSNYQANYLSVMQAYNALPYDYRLLLSTQVAEKIKEYELYHSVEYNRQVAQTVITAIGKLSTVSSPKEVENVRNLYEKLTTYQKAFVTNSKELVYIESVLKNPHLGWDPYYYDYDQKEEEDSNEIQIQQNGNHYAIKIPMTDMNRYSPTTISVTENVTLKMNRTTIPGVNNNSVVAVSLDEVVGESISFYATLLDKEIHFSNYVDIEVSGLPRNAVILRMDENGQYTAVPHTKRVNKYIIKTKTSGEFVVSTQNVTFQDIRTDGNRVQIEELAKRKIVSGLSTNRYQPHGQITIAQYSTMIARAMGLKATTSSSYVDVQSQWFESSIQSLLEAGILESKKSNYYNPNQVVTRQQAASIAVRMLKAAGVSLPAANLNTVPFKDWNKISQQDRANVAIAYQLGIFGGKSDGTFNPTAKLTRSEMAKVLHKTLQMAKLI
ncbi:MAG: S-layer homology domain-containing protein [Solibacillus sp.]|uniref:S-layer homology domain-containing protein n=1 Tax=Solibacillus sp. TaxID=1909654 RepID=UPI003315ED32